MRRYLTAVLLAALGALLVPGSPARADSGGSPLVAPTPGISVHGDQLVDNGNPWVPRGVQIVGLVAPDGALNGKYVAAHAHFSADELRVAVADHADVVRFQVSQFGIDPQGPLYTPAYVQEIAGAVQAARALGLNVILSLQAQGPAGELNRCPLPDAGAERAWNALAAMFAADRGVMFELYNEPGIPNTAAEWALWRDGGPMTYGPDATQSCQAVGMQTLVNDIRADGALNVIIVPGAGGEQTLAGMPALTDPASPYDPQLAYGIHYPSLPGGSASWDRAFGAVSADVPVIVTEWDAAAITTDCSPESPAESRLLLAYLATRRIGIVGFALDLPGTIIADYSYAPTTYDDFTCGVSGGGPGQLLLGEFAAQAQAGDGTLPAPPPAWIVSAGAAQRLSALAPSTTRHLLNVPSTFVTGASDATLAQLGTPAAVPTASFADEATLSRTVTAGLLPPGTEAIVYAPARSRSTPVPQQRNPALYFQLAAQIAHRNGLLLIAAPAASLARAIARHTKPSAQAATFLHLRIAADAARYADVYETVAGGNATRPARFAAFVRAASAQAAHAHRGIELLTGLRVGAGAPTASQLLSDVSRTGSAIAGYFLNGPPAADAATVTFLRRLVAGQPAAEPAAEPARRAAR